MAKSIKPLVKSPLAVTGLSIVMICSSLALIYLRLQNLRSLPSLNPFIEAINFQDLGLPMDDLTINVAFFSDIVILSISFVPLILGIGLWNLYSWARAISVCLLTSVLIPSIMAAIGIVSDRGATIGTNLIISFVCAIGLAILLNPKIISTFKRKRTID